MIVSAKLRAARFSASISGARVAIGRARETGRAYEVIGRLRVAPAFKDHLVVLEADEAVFRIKLDDLRRSQGPVA